MNPKQVIVPVERRRDFESYLEMVNGSLSLALGLVYLAKNTMGFADWICVAFLWDEIDDAGGSLFCGVELFVVT